VLANGTSAEAQSSKEQMEQPEQMGTQPGTAAQEQMQVDHAQPAQVQKGRQEQTEASAQLPEAMLPG
jgi:hypothetical protein